MNTLKKKNKWFLEHFLWKYLRQPMHNFLNHFQNKFLKKPKNQLLKNSTRGTFFWKKKNHWTNFCRDTLIFPVLFFPWTNYWWNNCRNFWRELPNFCNNHGKTFQYPFLKFFWKNCWQESGEVFEEIHEFFWRNISRKFWDEFQIPERIISEVSESNHREISEAIHPISCL